MARVLLVAIAGAVGALARYGIGVLAAPAGSPAGAFPWSTFAINVAGSFALGVVLAVAPGRWPPDVTVGVAAGLLGAFTTFSTFSAEAIALARAGHVVMAAAYVGASIVVGLGAAAAGHVAGRALFS
ncbi:MAG TPA: CrcB family protein [Acidimicrobiales bacterium]|nr:CrcB family protein [Acidimicrobiales bacterium]